MHVHFLPRFSRPFALRRTLELALVFCFIGFGFGCEKKKQAVVSSLKSHVIVGENISEPLLTENKILKTVQALIQKSGLARMDSSSSEGNAVLITSSEKKSGAVKILTIHLITQVSQTASALEIKETRELVVAQRGDFDHLLQNTLEDMLSSLFEKIRENGPEIVANIDVLMQRIDKNGEVGTTAAAIEKLTKLNSKKAISLYLQLLDDSNALVRDASFQALIKSNDQSAFLPLVEYALSDPSSLKSVLSFAGDIKTSAAKGFLFTLSNGHPNSAIRKLAVSNLKNHI